jgi:hypothetical protein
MAKDSDSLAGGFDAEDTSGVLSGLLAEEDEFDRRLLWRLGSWAVASVGAVIIAVLANQSSIGLRREQIASVDLARQSQQMQSFAKESQSEARRLASAVDTLNGDRDRLYSRLAVLEQGLESVTGAIARQNPAMTATQSAPGAAAPNSASQAMIGPPPPPTASSGPAPSPPAPATVAAASETPATTQKATPAPAVAPVAATLAAIAEKAATVEKPAAPSAASEKSAANPARAEPAPATAASETQAAANAPAPASALMASKSMLAPPDPATAKPIEPPVQPPKVIMAAPMPEVVASLPPEEETESDSASNGAGLTVQRTEFGVDVGGANSIAGLRALWRGLLKSRSNAALSTLRPIIVIKEGSNGLGMQLRLVAGPISDAAAAAKICATMIANDRPCATSVFEGQRLALNPEEPAASEFKPASGAKPAPQKRHVSKRPSTAEEPAPASEPSTLSYIFGKRQ